MKLWDVKTGECLKTLQGHTTGLAITFSPNDQLLATGGYEQTIKLWQVSTGDLQTLPRHTNRVCRFQP